MSASSDPFRLDPENVLGFKYSTYMSKMRGLAISNPSKYYEIRAVVEERIKSDAVRNLYTTIYNCLSKGQDIKGNPFDSTYLGATGSTQPQYPHQKINDVGMEISEVLGLKLNEVLELILPSSFDKLAAPSLMVKTASKSIDNIVQGQLDR